MKNGEANPRLAVQESAMADTTQPVGAPERIWLVIGADCPAAVRFDSLEEVTWCQDKIDDNSIEYVHANTVRAMMAERDAAREELAGLRAEMAKRNKSPSDRLHNLCAALEEDANESPFSREAWDQLEAEAAALRRELEELRAQEPVANVISEDEPETVDAGFVDWIGRVALKSGTKLYARPIPPDAREGREPLTEAQICRIITSHPPDQRGILDVQAIIRDAERMHGIGPAGTSADGKTRP